MFCKTRGHLQSIEIGEFVNSGDIVRECLFGSGQFKNQNKNVWVKSRNCSITVSEVK